MQDEKQIQKFIEYLKTLTDEEQKKEIETTY